VVEIFMFRIVDAVLDNLDRRMIEVHLTKIAGAREICDTLYEGYAPLSEIPYEDEEAVVPTEEDPTVVTVGT
jgi:hypothetical protein